MTRTEYDSFGRRSATIDAAGNPTRYAYDRFGNLAAVTNALGNAIVYEYDLRGRKTYEGGATYPVRYTYDVFGNKTTMMTYRDESRGPDSGDVTTWLYDEASGVMTNKVYADGKGPRYDYDANGRLVKRTWARGIDTFYAYNAWGNLTNTTYSDDTPTVAIKYDALGRQVEAHDAAGVTTFAYDAFGANTNETVVGVAGTNVLERFTDEFGRDAGYALNSERQTILRYDGATCRLAAMQAAGCTNSFEWTYLPGSDLKSSLLYPNGLTASWTYDNRGNLLSVRNAFPTNIISQYDYTYDAAGRRIQIAKSGVAFEFDDVVSYGYNARSELTNAVAAVDVNYRYSYQYDPIGNRESSSERGTNTTYAANRLNQYTQIVAIGEELFAPKYDDDGNQTCVKTATGIWQVAYNGENRPVVWTCLESNNQTITNQTLLLMSYDRMGRRVTKNDQRFVYDGYLQIADNSGHVYVWDVTEPVATRPLAWTTPTTSHQSPTTNFYTHDGIKNISEVVGMDCVASAHEEYSPFGSSLPSGYERMAGDCWRFSSECFDVECGTICYIYRPYDCSTGRWCQFDPIGVRGGVNLYGFVSNSPVNNFDQLGALVNKIRNWWCSWQCSRSGGIYDGGQCCCGGKPMDYSTSCCIDGDTYSKEGEIVAYKVMIYMQGSTQGGMNRRPAHYWLEWDGSMVEANLDNSGNGQVVYHPHWVSDDLPSQANGYNPPVRSPVKISRCDGYDTSKFKRCLTNRAMRDNRSQTNSLCYEYVDRIVEDCMQEQKK